MSENIVHVTDISFENDVANSKIPVLLDFWAAWCGPCKMIAPMLDEISNDYADRIKICKMYVDDNPNRVSALVHTELEVELLDSLILTTRCLVSTSLLDIVAINELAEVTANTSSTTLPSNISTLDASREPL